MAIGKDKIRRSVTYTEKNFEIISRKAEEKKTTISKLINELIEKEYNNGKTD